jgi:hypothetical protein
VSAEAVEFAGGKPTSCPFGHRSIRQPLYRLLQDVMFCDRPGGFLPVCSRGIAYSFCDWSHWGGRRSGPRCVGRVPWVTVRSQLGTSPAAMPLTGSAA